MVGLIITFIVALPIVILWVRGIDRIPKDYKGKDFLNWDGENDDWDKTHTENEL